MDLKKPAAARPPAPVLDHAGERVAMGQDGGADLLELRIAEEVIAVGVGVERPTDRLVGDLADALDQVAAVRRVLACIDDEDAVVGHPERRVGGQVVVEEIEVGRDLLELGRLPFPHPEIVEILRGGGQRGACEEGEAGGQASFHGVFLVRLFGSAGTARPGPPESLVHFQPMRRAPCHRSHDDDEKKGAVAVSDETTPPLRQEPDSRGRGRTRSIAVPAGSVRPKAAQTASGSCS